MLTFRRAIVVAVVLVSVFFLVRSHHTAAPHITADQLPRPTAWKDRPSMVSPSTPSDSAPNAKNEDRPPQSNLQGSNNQVQLSAKKPRPNISLQELHAKPLREQLEYQFPYDPLAKFPAYIWQTWKYTPAQGEFEAVFREAEASWTILHPTFVHEVITDNMAVHLIRHLYASIPEVLEAYQALPLPVLKADFFRYLILLARGGIYSDIDTAALKPATEWVPTTVPRSTFGLVIGIEADPDREDWADWYSRRIQFCQWTIQAKPGHPILRSIVANITEETLKRKSEHRLSKDYKTIVEFTGPAVWTDTIFNFFNDPTIFDMSTSKGNISYKHFTGIKSAKKVGDVIVLPITSFSPGVRQMGAGEDDDDMAFVKHNFVGSWKPESERHIGENQNENQNQSQDQNQKKTN